jgi:hypothetical protein
MSKRYGAFALIILPATVSADLALLKALTGEKRSAKNLK